MPLVWFQSQCERVEGVSLNLRCMMVRTTPLSQVVPIAPRLVVHFLLRTMPTALICIGLYIVLFGDLLILDSPELALRCSEKVCLLVWSVRWCRPHMSFRVFEWVTHRPG